MHSTMEGRFHSWQQGLPAAVRGSIMVPYDSGHRMVTVMFADFSGSTVVEAEQADKREDRENGLLGALVEILAFYEGRIDRFAGNGVLAVFGTPMAHEDDPERAVLAALQLRNKARILGFETAVGVTTGQISSGPVGSDEHHELNAMGPVVNLAVQLPSGAKPGAVVIDESTRRRVVHAFKLSRQPLRMTGIAEPISVYGVERRLDRPEKQRGIEGLRAELIGRDEELALLTKALSEVMAGAGRVVNIIGEAGVGKSRLVAELRAHAQSERLPPFWFEGRCRELGATAAYLPFVDILAQQFGLLQQADDRTRSIRLREALDALVKAGSITTERHGELGPLLGRLLSVRYGTEWDEKLAHAAPEQVKHQTLLGLRDLLLAMAGKRPAVLVLDDLHWSDALSLELVSLLMESLAVAPILLVCLYRPERGRGCCQLASIASRTCAGRCTEITLKELTPDQSRLLFHSLLPADVLPAAARESILTQSQGNPFFVEEAIRSLIESGVVYQEAGEWRARNDSPVVFVPDTLQSVILSRVDRLEPRLKRILEAAAVAGRIFRRDVLERACDGERVTDDLAALEDHALISPGPAAAHDAYCFRHVLMQQAIYEAIQRRRRGMLHRRIAQATESLGSREDNSETLAFHYERAGDVDKAVEYLLRAGERARDAWLNEGALAHFQRARELLEESRAPASARQLQVLRELGRVYEVIGRHDLAEARLREALDAGRTAGLPARELAQVRFLLCKALTARHRPQEYVPLAQESLDALRGEPDCPEALGTEFVIAYGAFDKGDFGAFCEYAEHRGDLIRSMPWSQENAINCSLLAWAYAIQKDEAKASEWLAWLEQEALRNNDLMVLAAVAVRRGRDLFAQRGDDERAVAAIGQGAELYDKMGARYLQARCYLYAGDVLYRFGLLDRAEAERERAEAICSRLEPHDHLGVESRLLRGQVSLSRGNEEDALRSFESALASAPGEQWEWLLRYLVGCALFARGDIAGASRSFMSVLGSTLTFRVPPAYSLTIDLAHVLSLLETCVSEPEFRSTCELVQRKRPQAMELLARWHLTPAQPQRFPRPVAAEEFRAAPDAAWRWHDPYGDCGYTAGDGLRVCARVGRSMRSANLSAPRLLRRVPGDFAVEVAAGRGSEERPCIGGVVLWRDERNYLRLDRGSMAADTVSFEACIGNVDRTVGRGRMAGTPVWLRLERANTGVRALCRGNGQDWQLVGETSFPADNPLEIGLFAEGAVRPEIYPRSFGAGSEIVFRELRISAPA